jgi:hypothetical protein
MPFSRKDKPARGSAADGGVRPTKRSGSGFASHCTEIDGKNTEIGPIVSSGSMDEK